MIIKYEMKTKFKVLMHAGYYVDANKLYKGIYTCDKPFIYHKENTIDGMIETHEKMEHMLPSEFKGEYYRENLKKCYLSDIELLFTDL